MMSAIAVVVAGIGAAIGRPVAELVTIVEAFAGVPGLRPTTDPPTSAATAIATAYVIIAAVAATASY